MYLLSSGGLSSLFNSFINDWLAWIFFAMIAVSCLVCAFKHEWRRLAQILVGGAIVAAVIFGAKEFFGKSGVFTKVAENLGKQIGGN